MDIGGLMTTSKAKAKVGHIKGIVAPEQEGYLDIAELLIHNKPLGEHLHEVGELLKLLQDVSKRLDTHKKALKQFLHLHGYYVSTDDLKTLYAQLNEVHIVNPKHKHQLALLNEGFVYDVIDIDLAHILTNQEIPLDIKEGYYKVEHGTIVLDEQRKEEQEGLE